MKIFDKRNGNILSVIRFLLNYYSVNYTSIKLTEILEGNPEFPSLLAIIDCLEVYDIKSVGVRKQDYEYSDFETPFVCALQKESSGTLNFTVITNVSEREITYLDPETNQIVDVGITQFESMDKHIVLLIDGENATNENLYLENKKREVLNKINNNAPFVLFGLISFFYFFYQFNNYDHWVSLLFFFLGAFGILISIALIWYEIDEDDPFFKRVCGGYNRRIDCNAVLTSSGASFWGVKWSVLGFSYFATLFCSMIISTLNESFLYLFIYISIFVSPYIFYSIVYQWRIVKQWCPMCIGIQLLLFISLFSSLIYLNELENFPSFEFKTLFVVFLLALSFLWLANFTAKMIKGSIHSKMYKRKWLNIKYNKDVFSSLLRKESKIKNLSDGIGIVLGNPKGETEIIKVCNPYCGPCSDIHPVLEGIVKSNVEVKLRIIFTATGEFSDSKTLPVAHLLELEEQYGAKFVENALDDWYSADEKSYEEFSKKYPITRDLSNQFHKVKAMKVWCDEMKIRATPTLFINNYELPSEYEAKEITNFF